MTPAAVFGVTDDLKSHKCDFLAMRMALRGKWVFTELEASKQHEDPEGSSNGNLSIDLIYRFVCQVLNIDCFLVLAYVCHQYIGTLSCQQDFQRVIRKFNHSGFGIKLEYITKLISS